MPGPVSTNAPFTEFGQSMILRDIEMLYLLVNQSTGDLGKQQIQSSDVAANGTNLQNQGGTNTPWTQPQNTSKQATTKVKYLGTLDLPIYGKSNSVAGNAAGLYAVDWQQVRTVSTQVASGIGAVIAGGSGNTASGNYSFAAGISANASGDYSVAFSGSASSNGIAIGANSSSSGGIAIGASSFAGATGVALFGQATDGVSIRGGTVSGTKSASINNITTIVGQGSFFCNYVTEGSADCSVVLGLSNYNSLTLTSKIRNSLVASQLVSASSFLSGSGFVSNCSFLTGGNASSAIGNSGNISNSFAVNGRFFLTGGSTGGITDSNIILGGILNSSTASLTRCSVFNGFISTSSNGGSDCIVMGIGTTGAVSIEPNGSQFITVIGSPGGGSYTIPAFSSNRIYIGYGAAPTFTPVNNSTTISGELGISGKFGCNQAQPQAVFASGGAAAASPAAYNQASDQFVRNLVNNIRTALVNNGIMS